jgi:serine/threonine protein kinase
MSGACQYDGKCAKGCQKFKAKEDDKDTCKLCGHDEGFHVQPAPSDDALVARFVSMRKMLTSSRFDAFWKYAFKKYGYLPLKVLSYPDVPPEENSTESYLGRLERCATVFSVLPITSKSGERSPLVIKIGDPHSAGATQIDLEGEVLTNELKDCPGVPTVILYSANGPFHILVERPLGIPLPTYLSSHGASSTELSALLLRITAVLISILQSIHSRGVLHCDIKPSNIILVGSQETVSLIDFGCAARTKDLKGRKRMREFVGTREFASDAVIKHKVPTAADDYASLCYTIHAMETGLDTYLSCSRPPITALNSPACSLVRQHLPTAKPTSLRRVLDTEKVKNATNFVMDENKNREKYN